MTALLMNVRRRVLPVLAALFVSMCLPALQVRGQESVTGPYTGDASFKSGDAVEATYAGTWTKAKVVGIDTEGGRYKIHFEGEKYCNGHALDTWVARQWVRPVVQGKPKATPVKAPAKPAGPALPSQPAKVSTPASSAGSYKVGESVQYRNASALWLGGATVEFYDPVKRTYRLRFASGSGDIVPCHSVSKPGVADNSFFIGRWDVRVGGATSTFVKDGDLYRRFSGGAKQPPLEIKADGTYVWQVSKGKQLRGRWTAREGVPGITLLKGIDGKDWTLYEKTEGYAPTAATRDEIGFHHLPSQSGYYVAYRVGPNRSCVLAGRKF